MEKYIVYITINQCNGKFYIGVHKTNPNVFDGYIGCGIYRQAQACKDYAFHKAVKKYGYENFKRTIIEVFDTEEEALELEKRLVNKTLLKSKNCYNTSLGGKNNPNDDQKKRVYQFDLNGEFITSYNSARLAAMKIDSENVEIVRKAIKNNCLGTTNSSYGFFWSYNKKFTYKSPENWKKISQYTLSGKFLRTFDNITQAENELKINTIKQALLKKCTAGGFQWRYFEGDTNPIPSLVTLAYKNKIVPIIMTEIKSGIKKEYKSVQDCVNENSDLKASQINRVLQKIIKSHKGYIFEYQDEDIV